MAKEEDIGHEKSMHNYVEKGSSENSMEDKNIGFRSNPSLDRKVVLKLDLLLLPIMCALFVLLFLDRANIGNARVAGLQKDLRLTGYQYQTGVCFHLLSLFSVSDR